MPALIEILNRYPDFKVLPQEEKAQLIQFYIDNPQALKEDLSHVDNYFAQLPENKQEFILHDMITKQRDAIVMSGYQLGEMEKPISEEEIKQVEPREQVFERLYKEHPEDINALMQQEATRIEQPKPEEQPIPIPTPEQQWQSYEKVTEGTKGILKSPAFMLTKMARTGAYLVGADEVAKEIDDKFNEYFKEHPYEAVGSKIGEVAIYSILPFARMVRGAEGLGTFMGALKEVANNILTQSGVFAAEYGYDIAKGDKEKAKELMMWGALDVGFPIIASSLLKGMAKILQTGSAKDKQIVEKVLGEIAKEKPEVKEIKEKVKDTPVDKIDFTGLIKKFDSEQQAKNFINRIADTIEKIQDEQTKIEVLHDIKNDIQNKTEIALNKLSKLKTEPETELAKQSEIETIPTEQKPITEALPKEVKEPSKTTEIHLHLGINPFEAIKPLDELIANNLNKYNWYNKAFDSLRKIYDPFYDISREMSKELKQDVIYGKLRPIMAKIDKLSTEKTQSLIKIIEKVENEGDKALKKFITRYFENPEFEKYVNENIPELGEALKPAKDAIANFHNILHNRGYLKQAEYEKWNRAYFARIYARDEEDIIKSTGKIRQPEIQKGRKRKDIVAELTEEEMQRLGYKLDPISALKLTLAKQGQIIGMDEFFRALMDRKHEIIDPKALPFLVELPEEIAEKYPDLPKLMSPYFMRKRILPWLAQKAQKGEIDRKVVRMLGKITNKKIKALKNLEITKGFVNLGDIEKVRYGVLSGLPVRKSIANFIGITYPITIEPDPSKLDKALSFLFTNFKAMKVPLNFMAIPRNWISNYFQWVMSGADPFSYFKYYAKALYHAAKKDNFYEMVNREGLLHTNFASEEIQKVLEKFRQEGKVQGVIKRYFDLVSKLSTPYGMVDDLAKMARVEYEMEKGASLKEAIYKAQFAHYDYGLLPKWAHEARKGDVKIGTAWKIVATPFISYPVKTTELFVEMLRERPLTTLALLAAPIIAKYAIEKKQISNNPKLKKLYRLTPEYMNGSTILRYYHDGKMYYIPLDYIYPTGQIISELDKGSIGAILGIAKFFGFGESPFGNFFGAIMGKDPFTGKPVYQEIGDDAIHKVAKALKFLYRTWVEPGSATVLRTWLKTKHPLAPRFAGVNVYAYTPKELALIKKRELQIWKADLFREYFQIMRDESLTEEERKKQVRNLIKKYKERRKELLGGE